MKLESAWETTMTMVWDKICINAWEWEPLVWIFKDPIPNIFNDKILLKDNNQWQNR